MANTPISILSLLGKLIEKAVSEQLQTCLDETMVLVTSQSSFKPGFRNHTKLTVLMDHLQLQLD